MRDFAAGLIKRCTHKKVNHFTLYDVDNETTNEVLRPLYVEISSYVSHNDAVRALSYVNHSLSVLEDWSKASAFRLWVGFYPDGVTPETFQCCVVVGRRGDMDRSTFEWKGWAIHGQAARLIRTEELVNVAAANTEDLKYAADIAVIACCRIMRNLLDRPVEYVLSRGNRTPRERMLNIPAVVTISMSSPIKQSVGHGNGGGWKMPEHDVRPHERRLRSGKVVWVKAHKRGDPHIQRRTTYRVIP